jgi:hypothetical protein
VRLEFEVAKYRADDQGSTLKMLKAKPVIQEKGDAIATNLSSKRDYR